MKIQLTILSLLLGLMTFGQTTIKGKTISKDGTPLYGVEIHVNNTRMASSDFTGEFSIDYNGSYPVEMKFTYFEFVTLSKTLFTAADGKNLLVQMVKEKVTDLTQKVVSASRSVEKKIETPVTIETFSEKKIKNGASANFYDELVNVKETQLNTTNTINKSLNTRGFAQSVNTRFLQLADGAESTIPVLNASAGNILGVNNLDIESVEILPGASSALYGANAFNGIMFMNSISPFKKSGVSAYYKHGYTNQEFAGSNDFKDFGARIATKLSEKVALKLNLSYFQGTDWFADDYTDNSPVTRDFSASQIFNGVNIYGDEVVRNSAPAEGPVSRTGYLDTQLNDEELESFNGDFSFHFKPTEDAEIILKQKASLSTSNLTTADTRLALQDFLVLQTSLGLKTKNLTFRTYYTSNDAGDSYDMVRTANNINKSAKTIRAWYLDYNRAFRNISNDNPTFTKEAVLVRAREFADYSTVQGYTGTLPDPEDGGQPRFDFGTPEFEEAFNKVTSDADAATGSKIIDNSYNLQGDINYNFQDIFKFAEIQLGGTYRKYVLDSEGTVFYDADDAIEYSTFGAYAQIQKKLLDERLKLSTSVRYDKLTDLDGSFSPRFSINYAIGNKRKHNIRTSFQTGFRNPTSQDLYNGANYGFITLVGSAQDNLDNYSNIIPFRDNPVFGAEDKTVNITGDYIYNNSFTLGSVQNFLDTFVLNSSEEDAEAAIALLKVAEVEAVKSEKVESIELGYRANIGKFSFDVNGYYNKYTDFIYTKKVITPWFVEESVAAPQGGIGAALLRQKFLTHQVYTNANVPIETAGFGFGVESSFRKFHVNASYNFTELFSYNEKIDSDFVPQFNTPKHYAKLTLGSEKLFGNFGFNTKARWNSEYEWVSPFASDTITSELVLDAQLSYGIPAIKSLVKVGANNLFGEDYLQVIGSGKLGQSYFVSLTYNP